ncbi:hypothetical protein B0T13DRAFT_445820 [Neurospora crassa]|nr:hypothetical protein B0T13DRAFT_445820 [Neurospora crassa]
MNRKSRKAIRYKVWTEKPGTIGRRAPNQTSVSVDTAEGWESEFAEISSEVAADAAKQQRRKREEQRKEFVRVQVGREEGDRWLLYEPVTKWGTSTQSLPARLSVKEPSTLSAAGPNEGTSPRLQQQPTWGTSRALQKGGQVQRVEPPWIR